MSTEDGPQKKRWKLTKVKLEVDKSKIEVDEVFSLSCVNFCRMSLNTYYKWKFQVYVPRSNFKRLAAICHFSLLLLSFLVHDTDIRRHVTLGLHRLCRLESGWKQSCRWFVVSLRVFFRSK